MKSWKMLGIGAGIILILALSSAYYIYESLASFHTVIHLRNLLYEVTFLTEKKATLANAFFLNAYTNKNLHQNSEDSLVIAYQQSSQRIDSTLQTLKQDMLLNSLPSGNRLMQQASALNRENAAFFDSCVVLYVKKGFKDFGLEGEMRRSIHALESIEDLQSKVYLLTLRRHEKDFLLRKDESYIQKFDDVYAKYRAYLAEKFLRFRKIDAEKLQKLDIYRASFIALTQLEKIIGYDNYTGLRGSVHSNDAALHSLVQQQLSEVENHYNGVSYRVKTVTIAASILLIGIILTVVLLVWYYQVQIQKPLKQLRLTAKLISNGRLHIPEFKAVKGSMFESVSDNLFLIIKKLQDTMHKLELIVENKYQPKEDVQYDEVEATLVKMNQKLRQNEELLKEYAWFQDGIAHLGELCRNFKERSVLFEKYISAVCKHIKAVRGCILEADTSLECFHLRAGFALPPNAKNVSYLDLHGGLAGECYKSHKSAVYSNVVDDYYIVASGLGACSAPWLVLVPCMYRGECILVLEVALIHEPSQYLLQYLEKAAEILAFEMGHAGTAQMDRFYSIHSEGL